MYLVEVLPIDSTGLFSSIDGKTTYIIFYVKHLMNELIEVLIEINSTSDVIRWIIEKISVPYVLLWLVIYQNANSFTDVSLQSIGKDYGCSHKRL